jgi:hypothetical protein
MYNKDGYKIVCGMLLMISLLWFVSYKMGYDGEKLENTYLKNRMIKERKEKLWLQSRLMDCTECNLIHYSLIQDCYSCKLKAAENGKLKALYIELQ